MADPLDVITLDQAKEALQGLKGVAMDSRVAGFITAVSRRLDEACGPIVKRTVTESHTNPAGPLFLSGKVFTGSTVTITEAYRNETPVTVASTGYRVDDDGVTATVTRWSGWAPWVTVQYTAGRFENTEAVQEPFVTAAGMLLQHFWRPGYGGGSETWGPPPGVLGTGLPSFGFPQAVRDLLAGELLPPAVA